MTRNISSIDRIIRVILGLALTIGFFLQPEAAYRWLYLAGPVLLVTAGLNFCPIYRILGLSTFRK